MPALTHISRTTSLRNAQASWVEILELVVALVFVHLTANAGLLGRVLGLDTMLAVYAGFSLLVYCGANFGWHSAARRMVGWVGAPWPHWMASAAAGAVLGGIVTALSLVFGHSIRVTEPFPNKLLAVTLGPILEEICIRGGVLPVVERVTGPGVAIGVASCIFAALHLPGSAPKIASILGTGVTYGWIRVRSGSTALAALAHATYNLSVLLAAAFL